MTSYVEGYWAPFPEDSITRDQYVANVSKLELVGKLTRVEDLWSGDEVERQSFLFEIATAMHGIAASYGKDVELPMLGPRMRNGQREKVGRAAAGVAVNIHFPQAQCMGNFSFDQLNYMAVYDGVVFSASENKRQQYMSTITLPASDMPRLFFDVPSSHVTFIGEPGAMLNAKQLRIFDEIIRVSARHLAAAAKQWDSEVRM
jgi:hypothetical protein